MKVKRGAIQAVLPGQIRVSAGYVKVQLRKRQNSTLQQKLSLQVGRHGYIFLANQLRFSHAPQTQVIDARLKPFICEMASRNMKSASEPQAIRNVAIIGQYVQLRLQTDQPRHNRWIGPNTKFQEILYRAFIHHNIEIDLVAMGLFHPYDLSAGSKARAQETRTNGVQVGIAICSIDDCMKVCMQVDPMVADIQAEIGSISLAHNLDPA